MGVLDKLTGKTEPHPTGYESPGGQAGAVVGGHITQDGRAVAAQQRHREAQEAAALIPPTVTPPPQVAAVTVANDDWYAETFHDLQPGTVTEIVGRNRDRETMDITNQSSALNGGTAVTVILCRDRASADRVAAQWPKGRGEVLPDGAGRTHLHTANVFAVVDPAAAANATVDVHLETKRKARP